MIKNQEYEILIDSLGCNGEGVGRIDGFTVFVKGALKNERVIVKIIAVKPSFAFGRIVRILDESKDRVIPPCPVFNKCGGCALQHLEYKSQLAFKQELVHDTIKKFSKTECKVEPCVPSDRIYHYRNKAQVPVSLDAAGNFILGFYRTNSNDIVDIDDCLLHPDWFSISLKIFKEFLEKNKDALIDKVRSISRIRHFAMRETSGSLIYTIVSRDGAMPPLKALYEQLKSHLKKDVHIYININSSSGNIIFGDKFIKCEGFSDKANTVDEIHPASFMQVNTFIADRIYNDLIEGVKGSRFDTIIDAYSGTGRLTARLSPYAKQVFGIEINKDAVADADAYMNKSGLSNVKNIAGDTAAELPVLAENLTGRTAIILDPPRKGCAQNVLDSVLKCNAEAIFYISCNPATLSRDLITLFKNYTAKSITPYDMFPQTPNVETLVVLEKR